MSAALAALCARHGLSADVREVLDGVAVTLRRPDGSVVGVCGARTVDAATRSHAVILDGPDPRGAITDAPAHPALAGVAYRTKRVGFAGSDVAAYVEAGAQDPHGRAVRVWVSTDPADAPGDCNEMEECR